MMTSLGALLLLAPMSTTSSTAADRAAYAAEQAAAAAASAAESAAKAAAAMEKLAAAMAGGSAPAPAAAPAAEGAAPADAPVWSTNIGASMVWFAGNSEQLAIGGDLSVERKTSEWIFSGKLNGGYGESTSPTSGVNDTTALFLALNLRADLRFSPVWAGYVAALADTDHVKSVEYRTGGEGGVSVRWFEEKVDDYLKASLRTDLALRAQFESRFAYYFAGPTRPQLEDVTLVAPRLGVVFAYGITRDATFTEEAEFLPNLIPDPTTEGVRVLINSTSKLTFKLSSAVSFNTAFTAKFDNIPADGKDDLDTQLTVGLSVSL